MKENLIDALHEKDMLNFVIVSLFSADTLIDAEACRESLKALESLKTDLASSKLKDDLQLKKQFEDAEQIIRRDLEAFQNGGTEK
jgi:hypothetical protein